MRQASREAGFNKNWLGEWRNSYPALYNEFYATVIRESDLDEKTKEDLLSALYDPHFYVKEAIKQIIFKGKNMSQVSREAGFYSNWFRNWKYNHQTLYDAYCVAAIEEADLDETAKEDLLRTLDNSHFLR